MQDVCGGAHSVMKVDSKEEMSRYATSCLINCLDRGVFPLLQWCHENATDVLPFIVGLQTIWKFVVCGQVMFMRLWFLFRVTAAFRRKNMAENLAIFK